MQKKEKTKGFFGKKHQGLSVPYFVIMIFSGLPASLVHIPIENAAGAARKVCSKGNALLKEGQNWDFWL